MALRQCNHCRFWKIDATTIDENDPNWGFGFCRKNPPTLVDSRVAASIVPPQYGNQTDLEPLCPAAAHSATCWPATFADEWCGKFLGHAA